MTTNKTAKIQFYEGTDEPVVPEIRLTRSKDGTTGQALFLFEKFMRNFAFSNICTFGFNKNIINVFKGI